MTNDERQTDLHSSDPLDALLRDAFATELTDIADIDISGQVMLRLRRRLQVRAATLGFTAFIGLGLALMLALPGLGGLIEWIASSMPLSPAVTAVLPVLVLAALAPWLFAMVDDRV